MAKNPITGHPTDTPILLRPGVIHKESDYHGAAKHISIPPEHPERTKKGDLSMVDIPGLESRPLTKPGLPFVLKGK